MDFLYKELLNIQDCPIQFEGNSEILERQIAGFSIDSRTIEANEIFVAIHGEKFDGHQFINDVYKKGVQVCIVSESWFRSQSENNLIQNYFIVEDTLSALQEISRYYRLKFDIPLLALTGSNGKTTTKEMIAAVLEKKYNVLKNKGNLNNHIGVPLSLLHLSAENEIAVIEMGTNNFGEIARLAAIAHPNYGLITNIGPAHLEFFGSLEGVFKAKSELWQYLKKNGGAVFVNADDEWLGKNLPSVEKVIQYGFENKAKVQGEFLGLDGEGRSSFRVDDAEIRLAIPGMHNIYNALAAVSVGLEFELSLGEIKSALEKFVPTSKRMEVIRSRGLVIINDCYNSNPESARKSLLTLSQMHTSGKKIAVLADMLELGKWSEPEHEGIGQYAFKLGTIDYLLTYGALSKSTSQKAAELGMPNAIHFEDKKALVANLKKIVSKDDIVLIKGSRGMVMEDVTNELTKS